MFTVAPPSPGKCLAVAATRASRSPRIDARVRAAIPRSSPANDRVAITEPGRGTSATGARFTWIPAARSCRPARGGRAPDAARRALERLARGRPRVGDRPNVAALLVDHDECPPAGGTL